MGHIPENPEFVGPIRPEDTAKEELKKKKEECRASGGKWNEQTQTCIFKLTDKAKADARAAGSAVVTDAQGSEIIQTRADVERATAENRGGPGARQLIQEQEIVRQEQAAIQQQQQQLIDTQTPVRRELDPQEGTLTFTEKLPVLGGTLAAVFDLANHILLPLVPDGEFKEALKDNLAIIQPEELRTLALTAIERQEIERGLTASERFGALIEGIPVVGSLAGKYAGGLIETPSENAAQVKTSLLKEKRRIANIETNVKLGYLPVSVAQGQLTDIERNVQKLESRLKLLINDSPELKFNSDLVDTYETEILLTREKIFQGRLNVLEGISTDPTEIQILIKMQDLQGGDEES